MRETKIQPLPLILLGSLVLIWGTNWPVLKLTLNYLPPIWAVFLRTFPAFVVIFIVCALTKQLKLPAKEDLPVVFSVVFFHMIGFSVLVSFGLLHITAGRSIVIAYTTPLWVLPLASIFLREKITWAKGLGLFLGLAGLAFILEPASLEWTQNSVMFGQLLILGGAFSWAISIVYGRAHKWVSTPFKILPWQLLLASVLEFFIAYIAEGPLPEVTWTSELIFYLAYSSLLGTALAYLLMNIVSRDVPASYTSIILLGVPVVGILTSAIVLSEPMDISLYIGSLLILTGIWLATRAQR